VEHSKESISTHDLEGRMLSANPALARMLGYEVAELLQIPMRENVPPEFRDQFDEYLAKLRKDGVADGIAILKTRTGEHRISEYHCVVRTEGGSAPIVHKIGYDVTERMRAEEALRRSEEQLRHAQKMEVIGRIAGGVAHDFNNLLCGINLYLGLALEQVKPADRVLLDNLDRALDAARSAGSLTRQLLTISRRQVAERQVVNINDIVITASDLLGRLLSENIYTSMRLGQGSGKASVDPLQMQQVVMSLVLNARDAMPEGGQLTIRTVNVDLDAPPVGEYFISPPEPGPYVVLEVSDTGHGMSDEILAHLFEPFFTTKELGQGTGLGLATAYGIVTHSGGHISVQTTLGHGTTFKVYLPRVDDRLIESPPEIAPARETPAPSGARTVLVVDDTEVVRDAVSKDLRRHGYTVLTASNAAEAIRIAEEYRATIDLLLTDVALPGMNGWDLAQHFATKRPSTKILYMSGHDQAMFAANVAELNSNILLYKPFTSRDLLAAVSTAVGEPVAHQAESERQGGSREDPPQQ
jgi:PAS domain S-box-containing protein